MILARSESSGCLCSAGGKLAHESKVKIILCILQALVHEAEEKHEGRGGADASFYEITIASQDQPKLLCRLSETLVSHTQLHACTDPGGRPPPEILFLIGHSACPRQP